MNVVQRGKDEVVFGGADLLRKLLRGRGEDDGWFQVGGIFFDGFEVERDDGALRVGLVEALGFPVLIELYDDLAVEHAVNLGLPGMAIFFGPSGV